MSFELQPLVLKQMKTLWNYNSIKRQKESKTQSFHDFGLVWSK